METREVMERLFDEISQLELPPISPKVYEAIKRNREKHENMEEIEQCPKIKQRESS